MNSFGIPASYSPTPSGLLNLPMPIIVILCRKIMTTLGFPLDVPQGKRLCAVDKETFGLMYTSEENCSAGNRVHIIDLLTVR